MGIRGGSCCFLFFLILHYAILAPTYGGMNGELCVVESPLTTRFLAVEKDFPAACFGCLSEPPVTSGQVHVIRLEDVPASGGPVELFLTSERPSSLAGELTLVLDCASPQRFVLRGPPDAVSKYLFLVTSSSQVEVSDAPYSVRVLQVPRAGTLLTEVREAVGTVTSFTRAVGANRIRLKLTDGAPVDPRCNETSTARSPLVSKCTRAQRQNFSGCYHESMVGRGDKDIHIVDLEGKDNASAAVELSVIGDASSGQFVSRNFTLVLKASRSTRWVIDTYNINGIVTVLMDGDDQVGNRSMTRSPRSTVEVRKFDAPNSFDLLLITVLTNIGQPVSYLRTGSVSHITIFVPASVVKEVNKDWKKKHQEKVNDFTDIVRNDLQVLCHADSVEVSLPRRVSQDLVVQSMTFDSQECISEANGTHLRILAPFDECGFNYQNLGLTAIYTSQLHIDLRPSFISDDEDFEGSGGQDLLYSDIPPVPVVCEEAVPSTTSELLAQAEKTVTVYSLKLSNSDGLEEFLGNSGLSNTVPISSKVLVEATVETVLPDFIKYKSYLQIIIEKCWLSDIPDADGDPKWKEVLIKKACRFKSSVEILDQDSKLDAAFNFKILSEYKKWGQVYIHCTLGVCSKDSSNDSLLVKCNEPVKYCSKRNLRLLRNHPISSSIQTVTKGPLVVVSSNNAAPSVSIKSSISGSNFDEVVDNHIQSTLKKKTSIIIMPGLSTEIVIGIALASFIIGVSLTGLLWLIYLKTDPKRQQCPDATVPHNSGYDLSAHSGSSTPSSQTPMTT